jgi:diaminopimelate epimerase
MNMGIQGLIFTKMQGTGNDFIVVEAGNEERDWTRVAVAACDRHFGIGGDGLLLVLPSKTADVRMRLFNADGSEAEMCGNGGRCAARFAADLGLAGRELSFRTRVGVIRAWVLEGEVRVQFTEPTDYRPQVRLDLFGDPCEAAYLDTGVPHVVLEVADVEKVDVYRVGRLARYDPSFAPRGANANFAQVIGPDEVVIRTYERGVEDETLACGTGCVATAIALARAGRVKPPVRLHTRGGEVLTVDFALTGPAMRPTLQGPVRYVAQGTIHPEAWK